MTDESIELLLEISLFLLCCHHMIVPLWSLITVVNGARWSTLIQWCFDHSLYFIWVFNYFALLYLPNLPRWRLPGAFLLNFDLNDLSDWWLNSEDLWQSLNCNLRSLSLLPLHVLGICICSSNVSRANSWHRTHPGDRNTCMFLNCLYLLLVRIEALMWWVCVKRRVESRIVSPFCLA